MGYGQLVTIVYIIIIMDYGQKRVVSSLVTIL